MVRKKRLEILLASSPNNTQAITMQKSLATDNNVSAYTHLPQKQCLKILLQAQTKCKQSPFNSLL
jgi:glycine betaine/choline ABC-type transport system substrate-binding protein